MAHQNDDAGRTVWDVVSKIPISLLATSLALLVALLLWSIFISHTPFQIAGFPFGAVHVQSQSGRAYGVGNPMPSDSAALMTTFSQHPGTSEDLPGLSVSITLTEKRPVIVSLVNGNSVDYGRIGAEVSAGSLTVAYVDLMRKAKNDDAERVDGVWFQALGSGFHLPPSSLQFIDLAPPEGDCQYFVRVTMKTTSGNFHFSPGVRLVAWQL